MGERVRKEPAAANNTRWYTGHPQDSETGLIYMGARYYDPTIGRFMAVDPAPFTEKNIHSFNRYNYANNNPYKYVDPDGWATILLTIPPLIVGGIIYYAATPDQRAQMGSAVTQVGQNLTGNMQALGDKTRSLMGPIFNEGVEKPAGIPDNWQEGSTDKGGGREWVNPDNPHDRVRSYPGNPDSPNPSQREPYVRDVRNGNQWLGENGNRIGGREGARSPTTHIPNKDYKFPQ